MSQEHCPKCNMIVDTDFDSEHLEDCPYEE